MTLIAAWLEGNTPVIIGDMLVTQPPEFTDPHRPLPTRDDLDQLLPTGTHHRIADFVQKEYKVSDNLAMGWAHPQVHAKQILKDVLQRFGHTTPSLSEVRDYFTGQADYGDLPCTFIGWVIEAHKPICFRWRSDNHNDFETAQRYVEGSGQQYFLGELDRPPLKGDDPVESTLSKVARALHDEVFEGASLSSAFGGGYTVIYHDGTRFVIVPSVTFIFYRMREAIELDGLEVFPATRMLKVQHGDQVIQTNVMLIGEDSMVTIASGEKPMPMRHRMHYTRPLTAKPTDTFTADTNLSMASGYYCICSDILTAPIFTPSTVVPAVHWIFSLCMSHDKSPWCIEIKRIGKVDQMEIKGEFFQRILAALKERREAIRVSDDSQG